MFFMLLSGGHSACVCMTGACLLSSLGAHRALCPRCACAVRKVGCFSPLVATGSQGPELCTPDAVLNGSRTLLYGGGLLGCSRDEQRNNWHCARAVPALLENAPFAITCVCARRRPVCTCVFMCLCFSELGGQRWNTI